MPSLPSYIYIGGAPTDILHGHGRVNSDIVVPSNGLKEQINIQIMRTTLLFKSKINKDIK